MPDDAKIDLSKYKTDELASKVAEILSVPESIRTVLRTAICAILCLQVANFLLYVIEDKAMVAWLISSIYALAIGIVLGFLLGIVRTAGLFLRRADGILLLTLQTSRAVVNDYQAVRSGGKQMPSGSEIVMHVYNGVMLPAIEMSVAKSFGLFSVPLLWVYRRTIGGCVRYLITRMKTDSLSAEDEVAVERAADKVAQELSENVTSIERGDRPGDGVHRVCHANAASCAHATTPAGIHGRLYRCHTAACGLLVLVLIESRTPRLVAAAQLSSMDPQVRAG